MHADRLPPGPQCLRSTPAAQAGQAPARQAATVPSLPERVHRLPRREIDRERPPLDPVPDDVSDCVAHRPQVMDHRPAHRDSEFPHHLPRPRLQHRPLLVRQVRGVTRHPVSAERPGETQLAFCAAARQTGTQAPGGREGFDASQLPREPCSRSSGRLRDRCRELRVLQSSWAVLVLGFAGDRAGSCCSAVVWRSCRALDA